MSNQNIIVGATAPAALVGTTTPRLGDHPKRGFKNMILTVKDKDAKYRPHHQKQLIIELLDFKQGKSTVKELVEMIEANPAYWARLNTIQSPYNCVVYHSKQLADAGYLELEIIKSETEKEVRKGKEKSLEIVEYANRRIAKEEPPKEDVAAVEADLNIVTEVSKAE